jgi:hypothetical protein
VASCRSARLSGSAGQQTDDCTGAEQRDPTGAATITTARQSSATNRYGSTGTKAPEAKRQKIEGLGHVLKGDACESTEDWCGRASAKGLRGYCCEQVRWRGSRHLHGAAVTAAPELGRPSLVPSNHDDQSSISSRERAIGVALAT